MNYRLSDDRTPPKHNLNKNKRHENRYYNNSNYGYRNKRFYSEHFEKSNRSNYSSKDWAMTSNQMIYSNYKTSKHSLKNYNKNRLNNLRVPSPPPKINIEIPKKSQKESSNENKHKKSLNFNFKNDFKESDDSSTSLNLTPNDKSIIAVNNDSKKKAVRKNLNFSQVNYDKTTNIDNISDNLSRCTMESNFLFLNAYRSSENPQNQNEDSFPLARSLNEFSSSHIEKGLQLLKKLGWNEGEGLGKSKSGILEPIILEGNSRRLGLFTSESEHNDESEEEIHLNKIPKGTLTPEGKKSMLLLEKLSAKMDWPPPAYILAKNYGQSDQKCIIYKVVLNGKIYIPSIPSRTKADAKAIAAKYCLRNVEK